MQDKVLIDNYIQYVNHRLDFWKSEQAKHKEKYAKLKKNTRISQSINSLDGSLKTRMNQVAGAKMLQVLGTIVIQL